MTVGRTAFVCCIAILGSVLPISSAAEPIRITAGDFELGFERPDIVFSLSGEGFSASGKQPADEARAQRVRFFSPFPDVIHAAPGAAVNLSSKSMFIAYPFGSFSGDFLYEATFTFITPVSRLSEALVAEAPFTASGELVQVFPNESKKRFSLVGNGRATMTYFDSCDPDPCLPQLQKLTYVFAAEPAPVPEPATLTVLGIGLAAMGWKARRRLASCDHERKDACR